MADIFFPKNLSPQGYINDFLTAQMYSPDFEKVRKFIHHKDFLKETEYKLFSLDPAYTNSLETRDLQIKKNPTGDIEKDTEDLAKYVKFLSTISPEQIAACVPYIRMYVKFEKNDKVVAVRDIIFRTYTKVKEAATPWYSPSQQQIEGSAGIENISVTRSYQLMGVDNDYTIQASYLFQDYKTFISGAPVDPDEKFTVKDGGKNKFGLSPGHDYIYLVKRATASGLCDEQEFKESLYVEYGWKFPDSMDESLVDSKTRKIFEEQEKKILRLIAYKHDLEFSQTGQIRLKVAYIGAPLAELRVRDENRKNDVFSISNKSLAAEMFENKKGSVDALKIHKDIKEGQDRLNKLIKLRQRAEKCECPSDQEKALTEDTITTLDQQIATARQQMLQYIQQVFLRYLLVREQLFFTQFSGHAPDPGNATSGASHEVNMQIFRHRGTEYIEFKNKEEAVTVYDRIGEHFTTTINLKPEKSAAKTAALKESYGLSGKSDSEVRTQVSLFQLQSPLTMTNIYRAYEAANSGLEQTGIFTFFPLRALLASIYELQKDFINQGNGSNEFKELPSMCLGNILTNSLGKDYWLNIGDILIEVGVFQRWLYNEFVVSDKGAPTLDQFLSSIFNTLIPRVLNTKTGHYAKAGYANIAQDQYELLPKFNSFYKKKYQKGVSLNPLKRNNETLGASQDIYQQLIKSIKTNPAVKENKKTLLYYYQATNPDNSVRQARSAFLKKHGEREKFDQARDFADGIYYVYLGQSKGIVKVVTFNKLDQPFLNTLLARRNPNDLEPYMRYTYQANVNFVGNNLYFGRSALFAIPVNQFNISTGKDPIGLTGYYRISSTTDQIGRGEYTTTVTATNIYSPKKKKLSSRCKKKGGDKGSTTGTNGGQAAPEKSIPKDFVEHILSTYMKDILMTDPHLASLYSLKYVPPQKETVDEPG